MSTFDYTVTGMTCGHCERSVTHEVSQLTGVDSVDVSAATGQLRITASTPIDDALVIAAVDEAGYAATRA